MGFQRQPSPTVRSAARGGVVRVVTREEIARIEREQDPFGIELHCTDIGGHRPIASCGEIVCAHCARVFWR